MDRSIRDEDLIRVESFCELREGMTVVVTSCTYCNRRHVAILGKCDSIARHADGDICSSGFGYFLIPDSCTYLTGTSWCFCATIPEGRLYRVRPVEDEENPYVQKVQSMNQGERDFVEWARQAQNAYEQLRANAVEQFDWSKWANTKR